MQDSLACDHNKTFCKGPWVLGARSFVCDPVHNDTSAKVLVENTVLTLASGSFALEIPDVSRKFVTLSAIAVCSWPEWWSKPSEGLSILSKCSLTTSRPMFFMRPR